jgi:hypothetical protein
MPTRACISGPRFRRHQ